MLFSAVPDFRLEKTDFRKDSMIDIHSHILPALDDGSPDWESTMAMADMCVESGVTAIVATPHSGIPNQELRGRVQLIRSRIETFRELLARFQLPLRVIEGMEIFGTPDTPALLEHGYLLSIGRTHYPLIEFPFWDYGRTATEILRDVLSLGLRPVVAHPERYEYVQQDPGLLNLWTDMGCLLQCNRGSLVGRFGPAPESTAWAMVERRFAFAVASDAHSPNSRTTWMRDVQQLLRDEFSPAYAAALLKGNPEKLLRDEQIRIPEPDWF